MFYERILRELSKQKVKYLVIGGVAVNLRGYFRATGDLDIFISLDKSNLKKFIVAVKSLGLKPRIPVPLEDFQDEAKRRKWITEKGLKVFSLFNPRDPLEAMDVMILSPVSFDKAYKALNDLMDWPPHTLELFIQVSHANAGKLSANKRKSHFHWMKDHEIRAAEMCVQRAFSLIS